MATLYSTGQTNRRASPASLVEQGGRGGRVHCMYDEYTSTAALSNGDIIKMGVLPMGARIVGAKLYNSDHGTTGTCVVGWASNGTDAADNDGIFTTVDLNTAALLNDMAEYLPAGFGQKFAAETDIQIELTAATTAVGSFKLAVFYVVD